ncbi:Protein kinase domain protein [compost metagenome]
MLLDFGAARQALRRPGQALTAMFTPGYAAPEQYDAKAKLGPWTDIYGLGASLYAMLGGGRLPAADERLQADTLQPASKLFARHYSPQLLALVDACLQLEPQRRPGSLAQMQQSLLANDYVTPLPSLWQKAGAWLTGKKR